MPVVTLGHCRYVEQQIKRAKVMHARDKERRAAVRVQARWRAHRGKLAYHLKLQARQLADEQAAAEYVRELRAR